jgi:PAS domain S-box-containing protein
MAIVFGLIGLFLLSLFLLFLPFLENQLFDSRKMAAKNLVEAVYAMLENQEERVESGEIRRGQAMQEARQAISAMRFTENNYFWINDTTRPYPKMVIHPAMPELEGRIMEDSAYKTASRIEYGMDGKTVSYEQGEKNIFHAFLELCQTNGQGFVRYEWPRPTADGLTDELFPKESYVKLFEPWGWIIGTGIYLEDVYAQMGRLRWAVVWTTLAILFVALLASFYLMRTITRPIQALVGFAADVAGGRLDSVIEGNFRGEMRELKNAISHMVGQLDSRMQEAENKAMEAEAARQAFRESEEKYRILVENAQEAIFVAQDARLRFANARTSELTGYSRERMTGSPFQDFIHPDDRELVLSRHYSRMKGDSPDPVYTFRIVHRNGAVRWVELKSVAIEWEGRAATLNFLRDVTEQKQIEATREKLQMRVRQSQKMEALGRLTGGVAHDFNNILSIIMGYAELAESETPASSPAGRGLQEIQAASLRARDVIRQLLTFSRKGEETHSPQDIRLIVREAMRLMRSTIPSTVEIREHISEDVPSIWANPTQIHQVIVNLSKNGADAMAESGGVLTVELEAVSVSEESAAADPELFAGDFVRLSVADSGAGIAGPDLERIFDPYFTTKAVDKGTGLGLSVVLGIVKSHGGAIRVESEPGEGTRFELYFPVAPDAAGLPAIKRLESLATGTERILFIDDEPSVSHLNKLRLEKLGYQVESRTDPEEALRLFANHPDAYDLVITDMTMPKLRGDEMCRELMRIRPGVKVILCTGYSDRISEEIAREMGIACYIEKPVDLHALAAAVRAALDEEKEEESLQPL